MAAQVFETHPAAEQFAADLKLLSHAGSEVRLRGCARIGEAGSAAVKPLLQRVVYDHSLDVRREAMWTLVRIGDDLQHQGQMDRNVEELLREAGRRPSPFIQLCETALRRRRNGGSAASASCESLSLLSDDSNEAALSLLERLIRDDLHEPDLEEALDRAARHRLQYVRSRAVELKGLLNERRGVLVGSPGPGALLNGSLKARRALAQELPVLDLNAPEFLLAAVGDPDRTVRFRAMARLMEYLRGGKSIASPFEALPESDTSMVFSVFDGRVKANPAALSSFRTTLESGTTEAKRRVLELIAHLRPMAAEETGLALDTLVRQGMQDKDREVRRSAMAAAKFAGSPETLEAVKGRLKNRWRSESVISFATSVTAMTGVMFLMMFTGHSNWAFPAGMLTHFLFRVAPILWSKGELMAKDEFYETLCALEPVADTRPEELRSAIPQLRSLSSRIGAPSPEVRAKARELLAKVHEATLHELPIAATAPVPEPQSLPVPATPPEQQAARP